MRRVSCASGDITPKKYVLDRSLLYVAHTLLGVLHVCGQSEFPNSNHVGFPFEPSVSVVVCHAIRFDPARYELIPRPDLHSSDVY